MLDSTYKQKSSYPIGSKARCWYKKHLCSNLFGV